MSVSERSLQALKNLLTQEPYKRANTVGLIWKTCRID